MTQTDSLLTKSGVALDVGVDISVPVVISGVLVAGTSCDLGVSVGACVMLTSVGGTCKVGVGRGLHAASSKVSAKTYNNNLEYFMVVSLAWKAIGILYWFFDFWLLLHSMAEAGGLMVKIPCQVWDFPVK
jgi:hypothetical protein